MTDPTLIGLDDDDDNEEDEEDEPLEEQEHPPTPPLSEVMREDYSHLPDFRPERLYEDTDDVATLKKALDQAADRIAGFQKREAGYLRKVSACERDLEELRGYAQDMARLQSPEALWARRMLLDPAVALDIRAMHRRMKDLEASEARLREDLQAAQFSSESAQGQSLLAKCRKLDDENKELGRRLEKVRDAEDEMSRLKRQIEAMSVKLAESDRRASAMEEERDEFSAAAYTLKKRLQVYERPAEQEQEQEAPENMEVAADAAAE